MLLGVCLLVFAGLVPSGPALGSLLSWAGVLSCIVSCAAIVFSFLARGAFGERRR
ncbi:hypothetical protein [Streptomyces sp. NBC_01264]|uniref:hypothetical protein n=1 Tax=Streptomyces sp. NBC_01264 TaxID=2903804 RepID=UPI002251F08D|nr:hypothetical protein [Streptomyces sp. NBC_01264]MCX4775292.1 hypothetical protein [Streptomyces sp. NBC_01264]